MTKPIWQNSTTESFRDNLRSRASKKRTAGSATPEKRGPGTLTAGQLEEVKELLRQHEVEKTGSVRFRVTERDADGKILEFEVVQ